MADRKHSRPPTRERRVKSAIARLTPPSSDARDMDKLLKKMTQERVNSAKANKTKHTSSTGVFAAKPAKNDSEEDRKRRFATMYSLDYDGTYVPPPDLRPTSPTRRNNPHPSKQFIKWKIPSREIGAVPYEEGLELPPEYLAHDENFDAIDDLRRNFGGLKMPPVQASSTEYGAYLQKRNPSRQGGPRMKQVPVGTDVIQRVVTGGNEAALHEWLANATPEEQNTILKMLKNAEEEKVKKTISTVMQPDAARAVRGWLKDADEEEKEIAVRLFSSLGSRPGRPRSRSVGQLPLGRPMSRQPVPPSMPPPRPSGSAMGSRQRRLSGQQPPEPPQPWPAGIWHHKPVRDPPPQVYHRGSLFGTVREDASHFNIHPEWQDYYGNRDPVH